MHELSIATSVLDIAAEKLLEAGGGRLVAVTVRVGRLSGVHEAALQSAFEVAREQTPFAETVLRIVVVPVTIFCEACGGERELSGIGSLACPSCGRPSGDLRGGNELEIESIEITSAECMEGNPGPGH